MVRMYWNMADPQKFLDFCLPPTRCFLMFEKKRNKNDRTRFDEYSGCDKILNFSFFRKCFTMRDYVLERSCEVLSLHEPWQFFFIINWSLKTRPVIGRTIRIGIWDTRQVLKTMFYNTVFMLSHLFSVHWCFGYI